MAINPERVKAGDELYDVRRQRMGNTTMSRMCWWRVRVIEVGEENGRKFWVVSWNCNPPTRYSERAIARLRRSKPKEKTPR